MYNNVINLLFLVNRSSPISCLRSVLKLTNKYLTGAHNKRRDSCSLILGYVTLWYRYNDNQVPVVLVDSMVYLNILDIFQL